MPCPPVDAGPECYARWGEQLDVHNITKDRDGEKVWKKGGEEITLASGRINWFGRDVDWADKKGFRGKDDVESPFGEWTKMEVIADGDKLARN